MGFFDLFKARGVVKMSANKEVDGLTQRLKSSTKMLTPHGILISKAGNSIIENRYTSKYPAGDWLWFIFNPEPEPAPSGVGRRHIIVDVACFWLTMTNDITLSIGAWQIPMLKRYEILSPYLVADGSFDDWKDAFLAIDTWFNSAGCRNV